MGGVRPRRLIVSTGDTTDYDGLLALQMYACAADTDAMVVLNSLAMHDGDGGSGADTLLGVFADSTAPFADAMFGKGFKAPTKGDRASIENLFSAFVRQAVAASGSNRLFVVQGGVNDINPFGHSIVKYDLEHYLKLVDPSTLPHGSACWDNLPNLNDYSSVWMDMNGSMAFYRPETPIYAWCRRLFASGKLRGLYIMGGILDSEASPLISPFFVKPGVGVNRLGCATMNQLYAAGPAGAFFEDCATHNVPLITATSNLIIKAFTITNDDEYHSALTPILHRAKPLFRAGFDAYYIPDFVSKPKKAYDVVSAIALLYDMIHTDTLAHRGVSSITLRAIRLPRTPKRLYFNNEYGISLVSSAPTAREAAEAYMRTLQEQLASTADAVVEGLAKNQRRQHMQAEVDLLTRKLNEDPVGFLKAYEVMDIDEMDVSAMTSLLKEVVDQASSSPLG